MGRRGHAWKYRVQETSSILGAVPSWKLMGVYHTERTAKMQMRALASDSPKGTRFRVLDIHGDVRAEMST